MSGLFARVAEGLSAGDEHPYRHRPVDFVAERLGENIWSKQQQILESIHDNRYTAVQACHGPGKSFIAARAAAWWLETWPAGEAFVVTTAPTFSQVRAILWREIGRAHKKGRLRGRVNQTEWFIDDELVAMGRKPADYDQTAFQGIHARAVLVIIDEACGVPKDLFDAVDSIVTTTESRVVAIGNPDDPTAHFASVCAPGSGWETITISAFDTPNFTGEPVPDRVAEQLVTRDWVEERKKRWGENSPIYTSKVLGQFPENATDTVIPLSLANAAAARTLEAALPSLLGVDVARFGADKTEIYHRQGPLVRAVISTSKEDTMQTAGRVIHALRETGASAAKIDANGVGAGVYDRLRELEVPVVEMQAGMASSDPERYANARAEWFWSLRERFEAGDIDLDPDDDEAIGHLTSMKWRLDSKGRIVIESKEDMKKRGMPSPDKADAIAMAFGGYAPVSGPLGV